MAEKKMKPEADAAQDAEVMQGMPVPDPEEKVMIRLFKDNGQYIDDLFVAVNGLSFLIKRGEPVEVPRYVAEVIEHSQSQDAKTLERISELENAKGVLNSAT